MGSGRERGGDRERQRGPKQKLRREQMERRGGEERSAPLQAGPGLRILLGITTRRHHHLRGQQLGRCQRGLLGSASATTARLLLQQSPAKPGEDSHGPQRLDISSLARAPPSLPKQSFLLPLFPSLRGFLLPAKQNTGPFPIPAPLTSSRRTDRRE